MPVPPPLFSVPFCLSQSLNLSLKGSTQVGQVMLESGFQQACQSTYSPLSDTCGLPRVCTSNRFTINARLKPRIAQLYKEYIWQCMDSVTKLGKKAWHPFYYNLGRGEIKIIIAPIWNYLNSLAWYSTSSVLCISTLFLNFFLQIWHSYGASCVIQYVVPTHIGPFPIMVKRVMMFIRSNHAPICHIICDTLPADFVLVCNFLMYALPPCYWKKCPRSDQRLLFSSSVRAMKTGSVTLIIFKRFSALLWDPCATPQQVPHPAPKGA